MNMKAKLLLTVLAAILSVCPVWAQGTTVSATTGNAPTPSALEALLRASFDRLFLLKAMQGNLAEVATGRLALRKARNPQVRMLAQHLIAEHSRANVDLMRVAAANQVPLPRFLGAMHAATNDHLSRLSGDRFDQMFMAAQMEAHENSINLYQQEIAMGTVPEARTYASTYLSAILNHTAMIYSVARAVNAPGVTERPQALINAAATMPMMHGAAPAASATTR
jgi:putative membrane protein